MQTYNDYINVDIPWIGSIPADWRINRGKEVLYLLERPVKEDDDVITCFRDGEVTLRKKRREDGFTFSMKEVGYQGIEPGDLVIHGMDGFAGAIGISDSRGKATPVLNVLDSKENKRYLMYYLRTAAFKDVFMALSTGIRVRSCDLRWNKLAIFPFILPTKSEQTAIADYLDDKVSRIDQVIAEAKASIEEYKSLKASVIYEAITKGLDPTAEMKDSGVEWIGKMPNEWKRTHIGRFAEFFNGDRTNRYPKPEEFVTEGIPFLNSTNINGDIVDTSSCKYLTEEKYASLSGAKIEIGDIIYCLRGSVGKCAINLSENSGTIASSLMTIRPKGMNGKYLLYVLLSDVAKEQTDMWMNGTCAANLSAESVSNYVIPMPPLEEQEIIALYLDKECSSIDSLISEKESLIADLEAYKKSLIYEVVTGKRKVL